MRSLALGQFDGFRRSLNLLLKSQVMSTFYAAMGAVGIVTRAEKLATEIDQMIEQRHHGALALLQTLTDCPPTPPRCCEQLETASLPASNKDLQLKKGDRPNAQ